jgi:hypothetical protein
MQVIHNNNSKKVKKRVHISLEHEDSTNIQVERSFEDSMNLAPDPQDIEDIGQNILFDQKDSNGEIVLDDDDDDDDNIDGDENIDGDDEQNNDDEVVDDDDDEDIEEEDDDKENNVNPNSTAIIINNEITTQLSSSSSSLVQASSTSTTTTTLSAKLSIIALNELPDGRHQSSEQFNEWLQHRKYDDDDA